MESIQTTPDPDLGKDPMIYFYIVLGILAVIILTCILIRCIYRRFQTSRTLTTHISAHDMDDDNDEDDDYDTTENASDNKMTYLADELASKPYAKTCSCRWTVGEHQVSFDLKPQNIDSRINRILPWPDTQYNPRSLDTIPEKDIWSSSRDELILTKL